MYLPEHFEERDPTRVTDLMERDSFGLLVSVVDGRSYASHVPFLREGDDRLLCHLASANPQSREIEGAEVLAIFTGPHAYVSPSWYASPGVPTWNYAVAHVYGRATRITTRERLHVIVERLTAAHEADSSTPWEPRYPAAMLDHIVGVEIAIDEIQAKFKLSQNRPASDQVRVVEQLRARGTEAGARVATLMAANLAMDIDH